MLQKLLKSISPQFYVMFLQKIKSFLTMKKLTSKVAYLWQFRFFFLYRPNCQKQPRIDNLFHRFLYPKICGILSGNCLHWILQSLIAYLFEENLTKKDAFLICGQIDWLKSWKDSNIKVDLLPNQPTPYQRIALFNELD